MLQFLRLTAIVFVTLIIAFLTVRALQNSVFDVVRIKNESMLPYLKPGQVVLISKLSPCAKLPFVNISFACSPCEIGHAYIFKHPLVRDQNLVKFAIPAPKTYADALNSTIKRDIIWFTQGAPDKGLTVQRDRACYFAGSNQEHSIDSRHFGPVPWENILGKVIFPRLLLKEPEYIR